MDGLLEHPKPHETDSIPAEFPGVDFDADEAYGTATDQEVENENTMDARASENSGIVHGTPHTDGMEGTAPPLLADDENDDIKEVDMPENEPAEIIDVDADDATDGDLKYPTDENPGDNPYQNQDGVSNTEENIATVDDKYTTKDRAAGDKPKGSIKVEDVDDEDDGNDSDDDADHLFDVPKGEA